MRYVTDVTTVATTAAEAFAQGVGVCQDYAHVMIALCRLRGLPRPLRLRVTCSARAAPMPGSR